MKAEKSTAAPPEVSVGMVGHVDHGKTTLTQALTGKWTDTHSEEIKRGITIRLGYSDAVLSHCSACKISSPKETCSKCEKPGKLLRTVSFVDAPGHETLMTTVLSGAAIMDGAILVISANEKCPQPQTREHLQALDISGIRNIVIAQNKIDIVTKEQALENHKQIVKFLKGSVAEKAPVIPVSAQQGINIPALIDAIENEIPTPKRDLKKPTRMLVARSFDANRPGTPIERLGGGIVGGSLTQGMLKVGDNVEIKPGTRIREKFTPLKTRITGMKKGGQDAKEAGPGGLIGVATSLDPSLTKSDSLVGNVLGKEGKLPPVWDEIEMKATILNRVVGSKEELAVDPLKQEDLLMLTVGISRTVGSVTAVGKTVKVKLKLPVCADKGDKIAISRQVKGRWRLIGWAELL